MNQILMQSCEAYRVRLMLLLDNELDCAEKAEIEAHIKECPGCRDTFNKERRLLECVHRAGPLHVAPDELRDRVGAIVNAVPTQSGAAALKLPQAEISARMSKPTRRCVLAAMALILTVAAGFWGAEITLKSTPAQPSFAAMAVDAHQRYLLGQLPLELVSNVPEKISEWFEGKVSFSLKLPDYRPALGKEHPYKLEGARLVGFKDDYAAYVAYEMNSRPISLAVTASSVAKPSGGVKIPSKNLVFHYEEIAGLKVITWSHRGLTYSLVSDLEPDGQQSCLVCHQGERDQSVMGNVLL